MGLTTTLFKVLIDSKFNKSHQHGLAAKVYTMIQCVSTREMPVLREVLIKEPKYHGQHVIKDMF